MQTMQPYENIKLALIQHIADGNFEYEFERRIQIAMVHTLVMLVQAETQARMLEQLGEPR